MPLRKPGKRRSATARAQARERRLPRRPRENSQSQTVPKLGRALVAGAGELVAIAREMLRIPAALWMRIAERTGQLTLAAWRIVRPLLVAAAQGLRRLLRIAEREVTPVRGTAVVLAVAIGVLAASQFVDYREVRAGVPDYAGVAGVAPPPLIPGSAKATGSAHGYVVLGIAVVAMAFLLLALRGRWRLARLLAPLGLAVVAISLLVDAPKGLDEGVTAIQFEGAEAQLLAGFWTQLVSGGVIALIGPLLALDLSRGRRPARARRTRGERKRSRASRVARSRVEGAGT